MTPTEQQKAAALEDFKTAESFARAEDDDAGIDRAIDNFKPDTVVTICALLQPTAPVEENCKDCPKDFDCEDYRIDGNPCDGKKGWFKCSQCDKLLPTQNGLKKHMRYHAPVDAEVRDVNPYPDSLSKEENIVILKMAEILWASLLRNDLGGYSGINRPFWIVNVFREIIETFGKRDTGLLWSKDDLEKSLKNTDI